MEDVSVNIARTLLNNNVTPNRPPSGKRERDKFIQSYVRQLSSSTAKKYASQPDIATTTTTTAASRRGCSGPHSVRLFVKVDRECAARDGRSSQSTGTTVDCPPATSSRRAQSAKARLGGTEATGGAARGRRRNHSARVRWEEGVKENRPGSAARTANITTNGRDGAPPCSDSRDLGPQVFGYGPGGGTRRIWHSESDISKLGKPLKSCLKGTSQNNLSGSRAGENKLCPAAADSRVEDDFLTDDALGVIADDDTGDETEDEEEESSHTALPLPRSLRPLAHWWTPDIPPEYIGIDHLRCWVFLPSMVKDYDQLPVVPTRVVDPTEPLPYKEKLKEPTPWNPKKYPHPWTKRTVDEWTCKHHRPCAPTVPPLQIYSSNGLLVHETTRLRRTVDVVRREIAELELLMKGVGTNGSSSLVVQYQFEINQLQGMVDNTLGRVEQIEKREREREEALQRQIKDYCGLRRFYKEHEEVMRQIRVQHSRCVRELAILERDLQLDTERSHFRKNHAALQADL